MSSSNIKSITVAAPFTDQKRALDYAAKSSHGLSPSNKTKYNLQM